MAISHRYFGIVQPFPKDSLSLLVIQLQPSCSVMSDCLPPRKLQPARLLYPWDFPGKNIGVGCHFLYQGTFSTQGSNPSLLHWQANSLTTEPPGKTLLVICTLKQFFTTLHHFKLKPTIADLVVDVFHIRDLLNSHQLSQTTLSTRYIPHVHSHFPDCQPQPPPFTS